MAYVINRTYTVELAVVCSASGAVGSLSVTERGSNHLVVQWAPPSEPNGIISNYIVFSEVGEFQLDFIE